MSYNFCLDKCSTACHDSSYCYFISQSNAYQLRQDLLISGVVLSTDQINKDVRDPVNYLQMSWIQCPEYHVCKPRNGISYILKRTEENISKARNGASYSLK